MDLNAEDTDKKDEDQESTPMDGMEEVTLEVETNADAGGDADEFKSSVSDDEGEY